MTVGKMTVTKATIDKMIYMINVYERIVGK
jgi:hypothetical protein